MYIAYKNKRLNLNEQTFQYDPKWNEHVFSARGQKNIFSELENIVNLRIHIVFPFSSDSKKYYSP